MLTKHTYFAASVVLILIAVPAAAFAATGGEGSQPRTAVANAVPAKLAMLSRSTVNFHRAIKATVAHLEAVHRAEIRRERRQREALYASLPGGVSQETLDAIAACESGGDPAAVSADGSYRGKYQFDYGTWESVGGSGDPAAAPEPEQDYRAALLYAQSGSSPWPICG
ncbi:MAG TPA: transglycosylase family protein [Solirubrobacterales bacterium]|nr:transglycosylase family protein [Solirubrobacterales bacterium]